ncbi:MAG TPA: type II toxin-antitoxin system RelE/ParE family toxin [Blastocatellia bacterium]
MQDLEAIADYIALDKPAAAARFIRRVFSKVDVLTRFPQIGSVPSEVADLPYRQLIIPPCRIFYRVDGKTVYIVHVMRGEQLLKLDKLDR